MFFFESRIAALIEAMYADVVILILADAAKCHIMRVEAVHHHQRDIDTIFAVQILFSN